MIFAIYQSTAKQVDRILLSESFGFTIEQLIEIAGISAAKAIFDIYKGFSHFIVFCGIHYFLKDRETTERMAW